MKCQTTLPACLLLLWSLTALVSCQDGSTADPEIKVKTKSDGIELTCGDTNTIKKSDSHESGNKSIELKYRDDNTGEYTCVTPDTNDGPKIFVKFRTCDNCIELDMASIVGMAVGNIVATIVIGVAVHLIASHTRMDPITSHKKSSDRQHLVSNEMSNRAPNDHYQPLHLKGQKDTYDVLNNRR